MKSLACLWVGLLAWLPTVALAAGDASPVQTRTYTLRYRFHPGETLRWDVVHRSQVDTTVSRANEVVETLSKSIKAWRVRDVAPDGTATFEHLVESVDMRQQMQSGVEVRYNSQTDPKPPLGFEDVARSIGVPLSIVTMDDCGKILRREHQKLRAAVQSDGEMTIPLPEEPVPVGHTWSCPHDIAVKLPGGGVQKIKARQTFTLKDVKTGVATIEVANQILTPVSDPRIESQLIQRETTGTVRLDIEAGRVVSQQMDVDKRVVGFHTDASAVHYRTRFTEELLPLAASTASRSAEQRR